MLYVTNQIRFLPITEGWLSRGRGKGLKGSPPTVDTLFYWGAFDEDLAWKTQMDILFSRSSLRKLVQVHFTLWILFRETEGSRDKHTSWRPALPCWTETRWLLHPPHPHLCVLIWENPGSLCQEPSQPVKKSWSLWYPLWMNYLLSFLNFVSVAWLTDWGNRILWDFEESESSFGRPTCLREGRAQSWAGDYTVRDKPFVSLLFPCPPPCPPPCLPSVPPLPPPPHYPLLPLLISSFLSV